MIKLALIVSSLFVFSSLAMAHEGHQHPEPSQPITTPDEVCSDQTQNLCAHIHFYKTPNTTEESTFVFHVESDSDEELNQLTLDLWMDMGAGHGHGSAPLALERIGKNKNTFYIKYKYIKKNSKNSRWFCTND